MSLLIATPLVLPGAPAQAGILPAASAPATLGPPALPPQPHLSARSCTPPALSAGGWTLAVSTNGPSTWSDIPVVDPWLPCRMYRASLDQSGLLTRSDDGGRTWNDVFSDGATRDPTGATDPLCNGGAPTCQVPQFTLSGVYTPSPHDVVLGESAVGDRVIWSENNGETWDLRNSGMDTALSTPAPNSQQPVYSLAFATSPTVAYAYQKPANYHLADPNLLYVTKDGGRHWASVLLPPNWAGPSTTAVVDPNDSGHLWLAVAPLTGTRGATFHQLLLETHDFGVSWQLASTMASCPVQLDAIPQQGHVRLVIRNGTLDVADDPAAQAPSASASCPAVGAVSTSDDDGHTWQSVNLPPGFVAARFVVDPVHRDHVLLVHGNGAPDVLRVAYSADGLASARELPAPSGAALHQTNALLLSSIVPSLQADRGGHFYLAILAACSTTDPVCPASLQTNLWELTPPSDSTSTVTTHNGLACLSACSGTPGAVQGSGSKTTAASRSCQLPPDGAGGSRGSLAYDGRDLLVTYNSDTGRADLAQNQALIRQYDPRTCAPDGEIVVTFSAQDLQQQAITEAASSSTQHAATTQQPFVDDMTYDPTRNILWAFQGPYLGTGLYAVSITNAVPGGRSSASAHLTYMAGVNGLNLAYMFSSDTLWFNRWCRPYVDSTCNANAPPVDVLDASSGRLVPNCLQGRDVADYVGWTTGAPDRLWAQSEDDMTVAEIDTRSCTMVSEFQHRHYQEPGYEDEQLACDPLTFADSAGSPTTLWLRDGASSIAESYLIQGRCPVPTFTRYLRAEGFGYSTTGRICASINSRYLEGTQPLLHGEPIEFGVDGKPFDTVMTDGQQEVVCTRARAVAGTGTHHVSVVFAGDDHYLPSSDAGTFATGKGPAGVGPVANAALPPGPPGQPFGQPPAGPPSAAQGGEQAQAQSQAEAQAQAQAQSQAQTQSQGMAQVQPGLMMQPQRRTRVATQRQSAGMENAYQARARRPSQSFVGGTLLAAVMLGTRLLRRRPSWATAQGRRRRRPT